jgi:hypothetical protein
MFRVQGFCFKDAADGFNAAQHMVVHLIACGSYESAVGTEDEHAAHYERESESRLPLSQDLMFAPELDRGDDTCAE